MRFVLPLALLGAISFGQTSAPNISGTWVGKRTGPMGEVEFVYDLKMSDGKITGSQRLPFGDSPVVDGHFTSPTDFELTVETESFGNLQKVTAKGHVAGDALEITPAMPPPRVATGAPGGAQAAGPGGGPAPGAGAGGGGGGMRAMMTQPITFHRGTPTPSYRAPAVNYATLPKVELPALHDVPYNGLAKTPPMGWNSWNKFRTKFDDRTVREIADAMAASGMKDAGYQFINIDDGWQGKRDENGVLQPNPNFPDMKALADYVHSKGLKLGIYSSPGPRTCAQFEGSYGHEEIDAKTWAAWGIDYLKYDWCSGSRIWKDEDMHAVYQRMGDALRKSGRPIVFSLCQYGRNKVEDWGPTVSGNLWRTTGDIRDQWQSMERIGFSQSELAPYAGPGHWNDPDMLEIGNGGMTTNEYRTHMSLWAMLAAPLIAGNDIRSMTAEVKDILLNRDVIAVDQDKLGHAAVRLWQDADKEAWVRPLDNGAYAIALFNRGSTETEISVPWESLKIKGPMTVRDLWAHEDLGHKSEGVSARVPPHGAAMFRVGR